MMRYEKTILKLVFIVLLLSIASVEAYAIGSADDINQPPYAAAFRALDKDSSQSLGKTEAASEELFARHFAEADANHDGVLSELEYANYRTVVEQAAVKRIASDSLITTRVKAALLKDEGIAGLKVSVETHAGVVLLSGFVKTNDQIASAGKIAAAVDGVKSVKNSLLLGKG